MAMTSSSMLPLDSAAIEFSLMDTVTHQVKSLQELRGSKATVILFICNHCPYVIHIRHAIVDLANLYQPLGVSFIAISSNDALSFPEDAPDKMKALAEELKFPFPYLYDESQVVAKAYDAACTPDLFVYNADLKLKYRGQFDGSRPSNQIPPSGSDLKDAIQALLAGEEPNKLQRPSIGCNIKWKS